MAKIETQTPPPPATGGPAPLPGDRLGQNSATRTGGRVKDLFRKYGKVAIGVHLVVYATFFAGCYVAVDQKVDVRGVLEKYGLLSVKTYDETGDADPANRSWLDKALSGSSSAIALAFICNKALFPVRTPITLALTPVVARFLQRRRLIKSQ